MHGSGLAFFRFAAKVHPIVKPEHPPGLRIPRDLPARPQVAWIVVAILGLLILPPIALLLAVELLDFRGNRGGRGIFTVFAALTIATWWFARVLWYQIKMRRAG